MFCSYIQSVVRTRKQLIVHALPAIRCKPNRREATVSQFHFNLVLPFIEFVTNVSWMISSLLILEDTFLLLEEDASREIKEFAHLVNEPGARVVWWKEGQHDFALRSGRGRTRGLQSNRSCH